MLRALHRWPGLLAAVLLIVIALGGAALSVFPALDRLTRPAVEEGQSVAELAAVVQAAHPAVEQIRRAPSGRITAYWFDGDTPGAAVIDPQTGAEMGSADAGAVESWRKSLHRALLLEDAGRWTVAAGAAVMLLMAVFLATRLLNLAELRRRFPFELLMVIGSALALAKGLEASGAAQLVADAMRRAFDGHGVYGALIGVYLLTLVLTELVTNNAAAALAFPIALATARAFGVDPTAFVMVVAYGASACFLVPFGYQTHLMVMSPGHYRVTDFFRAGLPVSLTYSVVVLTLTPFFFPLTVG